MYKKNPIKLSPFWRYKPDKALQILKTNTFVASHVHVYKHIKCIQ